ncbi:hypothetical protein C789_4641 [Microcystis aeruginosa FACHB-905 = DIANCHI905]|nr:hypothetical protein C789_4641 [Microcystis aeruginosa FACHB-905 = DIANCHI905]
MLLVKIDANNKKDKPQQNQSFLCITQKEVDDTTGNYTLDVHNLIFIKLLKS